MSNKLNHAEKKLETLKSMSKFLDPKNSLSKLHTKYVLNYVVDCLIADFEQIIILTNKINKLEEQMEMNDNE